MCLKSDELGDVVKTMTMEGSAVGWDVKCQFRGERQVPRVSRTLLKEKKQQPKKNGRKCEENGDGNGVLWLGMLQADAKLLVEGKREEEDQKEGDMEG